MSYLSVTQDRGIDEARGEGMRLPQ